MGTDGSGRKDSDADAERMGIASTVAAPDPLMQTKPSFLAMRECPKCHVSTPVARFCTACGAAMVARRFCSDCGARLKPGAVVCDACGIEVP